jgi:hypothetical protein
VQHCVVVHQCVAGGDRALRYTASGLDYVAMGYRPLPPPVPIDNERRYIGLSIYGVKGRYWEGLHENLRLAPTVYPGWRVRLYINNVTALDEPRLRRIFAEASPPEIFVVDSTGSPGCGPGIFWRYVYVRPLWYRRTSGRHGMVRLYRVGTS